MLKFLYFFTAIKTEMFLTDFNWPDEVSKHKLMFMQPPVAACESEGHTLMNTYEEQLDFRSWSTFVYLPETGYGITIRPSVADSKSSMAIPCSRPRA